MTADKYMCVDVSGVAIEEKIVPLVDGEDGGAVPDRVEDLAFLAETVLERKRRSYSWQPGPATSQVAMSDEWLRRVLVFIRRIYVTERLPSVYDDSTMSDWWDVCWFDWGRIGELRARPTGTDWNFLSEYYNNPPWVALDDAISYPPEGFQEDLVDSRLTVLRLDDLRLMYWYLARREGAAILKGNFCPCLNAKLAYRRYRDGVEFYPDGPGMKDRGQLMVGLLGHKWYWEHSSWSGATETNDEEWYAVMSDDSSDDSSDDFLVFDSSDVMMGSVDWRQCVVVLLIHAWYDVDLGPREYLWKEVVLVRPSAAALNAAVNQVYEDCGGGLAATTSRVVDVSVAHVSIYFPFDGPAKIRDIDWDWAPPVSGGAGS